MDFLFVKGLCSARFQSDKSLQMKTTDRQAGRGSEESDIEGLRWLRAREFDHPNSCGATDMYGSKVIAELSKSMENETVN